MIFSPWCKKFWVKEGGVVDGFGEGVLWIYTFGFGRGGGKFCGREGLREVWVVWGIGPILCSFFLLKVAYEIMVKLFLKKYMYIHYIHTFLCTMELLIPTILIQNL